MAVKGLLYFLDMIYRRGRLLETDLFAWLQFLGSSLHERYTHHQIGLFELLSEAEPETSSSLTRSRQTRM